MNKDKLTEEAIQARLRLWFDSYRYDCGLLPIDELVYGQLKEKLQQKTVTREWVENLVSDLNASYLEIGDKPGYQVLGDALHYLGVKVEKSAGS